MTNAGRIFGTRSPLRRQYAVAAGVFLSLVLGIIFLFGHLIAGSLSRRYIEDVLAGGREEAQRIASELGGAEVKELDVVETSRQVLSRTLEGDPERRIWRSIEVTDSDGKVVFSSLSETREEIPEALATDLQLQGPMSDENVIETENPYRISVPLGEVGAVILNVDRSEVAERVAGLRGDLLSQTIGILHCRIGSFSRNAPGHSLNNNVRSRFNVKHQTCFIFGEYSYKRSHFIKNFLRHPFDEQQFFDTVKG